MAGAPWMGRKRRADCGRLPGSAWAPVPPLSSVYAGDKALQADDHRSPTHPNHTTGTLLRLTQLGGGVALRLGHPLGQQQHRRLVRVVLWQLLANEALDALEVFNVVLGDEAHRQARPPRAGGAADAVDVVLAVARHVKVDDRVHRRDVQPPGRHVRRDQHRPVAGLELAQRLEAGGLRQAPVDGGGGVAEGVEHQRQPPRRRLRVDKHNRGLAAERVQYVGEVAVLVLGGHERKRLDERRHRPVLVRHGHLGGLDEAGALELAHLRRHGRGKEERPAVPREDAQHRVNLRLKVHVQQPVRLVEHQEPHGAHGEALGVLQVVHQPPRRRDNHVRALGQRHRLRHHVFSPRQRDDAGAEVAAERYHHRRNLDGQLPRRRHDHRVGGARGGARVEEALQDGQRERGSLAAARLRQPNDVAPRQGERQRLGLDGGGLGKVEPRARVDELGTHAGLGKGGGGRGCCRRTRRRSWGGGGRLGGCGGLMTPRPRRHRGAGSGHRGGRPAISVGRSRRAGVTHDQGRSVSADRLLLPTLVGQQVSAPALLCHWLFGRG